MKIDQSKLSKKTSNVMKAVPTNPTLPIIAYIKMVVRNQEMELTGTDLEKTFIERLAVDGNDDFECCVPGRFFSDLIGTMDGEIEIKLDGDLLIITHNGNDAEVKTMPTTEFPLVGELPDIEPVTIDAGELAYIIKKTYYACATDEARPIISGVHFDFGDKIKACGADGFRLAYVEYPISIESMPSVNIPAKFLAGSSGILGILAGANCNVAIYATDSSIIFELPESRYVSQLIIGNFPDVNILIKQPKPYNVTVTIKKKPFLEAIKTLHIYARQSDNLIMMSYQDECVMLYADGGEQGQSEFRIDAKVEGEHYQTAFNAKFMLDALSSVGNEFCISQSGNHKPIAVYGVGNETNINTISPMVVREKSD